MKIMIVTGRFGMGHYSAAEALREELLLEIPCPDVEVVDAVEALFPAFRGIVYHCFNFLVSRLPGLFNHLSRLADKKQIRGSSKAGSQTLSLWFCPAAPTIWLPAGAPRDVPSCSSLF